MAQDSQKRVDESWKEAVQKEKVTASSQKPAAAEPPQGDFLGFLSTLAMQTLMAMGEVAHPQTGEAYEDLQQARYLIDIIEMLSSRTKGNLTPQEETELKNLLYELRMKYVNKTKAVQ